MLPRGSLLICLLFLVTSVSWGQRAGVGHGGGGFHGGGFRGGAGFAPHTGMRAGSVVPPGRAFHGSMSVHASHGGPTLIVGNPFHHGHGFHRSFNRYGYGFYPYYGWYSPFWDWNNSSYDSRDDSATAYAALQHQTDAQIDRLSNEVEELREERASAQSQPSVPRPPVQTSAETRSDQDLPVILVFLDKHIQEVRNYAVANEVVVAFDGTRTRKYPLIDIDLAATMKLNDERGVNFNVPPPIMN